ncbi:MAG: arylsulfatase [Lentisphaerae bacterium]|jgi:arylsulfatase A|nr:arylsulfatase [Lentisphaerota bacterium]MBT4820237.1 arylsulfatase [Lentisphaerota bacterium]MBT5606028.1 arylsulfatase [Lentisphaerota bacterium]MBT7058583.1 arylsulfatase [Lentisphaerota bacterium]MBT7845467.1 arylsulfatase [Lentisphaerota bacterium]
MSSCRPPNIVVILADDMGYGDVAHLNPAGKIDTPHMDAMASEGMSFTDAHASSSVCTPSRYGILTGRYCWRSRLKSGVLGPYDQPLIEEDVLSLPQFLRGHGYHTACVGKWHLGMQWPFADPEARAEATGNWNAPERVALAQTIDYEAPITGGPVDRGFDEYFGVDVPNFAPYCFIRDRNTVGLPTALKPDTMFGCPGPMLDGWNLEAIMPTLTQEAVATVERCATQEAPFFLYFALTGPHTPIVPTEMFRGKSRAGLYGDWVMQMDDAVGQINAALRRAGVEQDTLVLVASDNGSPARNGTDASGPIGSVLQDHGHNPSAMLRGMKGDAWEGGHRIPFIAKWPGQIPAGKRSDRLVCLIDIMATCAAIIGRQLPNGAAPDSVNILPTLLGKRPGAPERREIVHHGLNGLYGFRRDAWKLIDGNGSGGFSPNPQTAPDDPPGQLYDLERDVSETMNRYAEEAERVEVLSDALTRAKTEATAKDGQLLAKGPCLNGPTNCVE